MTDIFPSAAIRILLVEDNSNDALLVNELLKGSSQNTFETIHVPLVAKAAELLARESFDAVLLDLSLPDGHGLEIVERINKASPARPIIVLTGSENDERVATKAIQSGAQDFLPKEGLTGFLLSRTIRYAIERKEAERKLATNEELLRLFIRHTPAAIAVLDKEMRYLQVSDRWIKDNRHEGIDVVGKSHYELFPDLPERWKEGHRRVLAGMVEKSDEDKGRIRPDGSFDWLQWESRPWHKPNGEIGGMILFVQIITDRINAELALRESEERFRRSFDDAPIGLALVSLEGRWLRVNRVLCEMVGRSEAELLAIDFQTITHPDDLQTDLNFIQLMFAGKIRDYKMDKRYFHKDGGIVYAQLNVSLVRTLEGKPLYFVSQIQDITERKHRETEREKLIGELREALAEVKTLSGMIPICGWCKNVRNDQGYWSTVEQYVRNHTGVTFSHGMCPECAKKFKEDVKKSNGRDASSTGF